MRASQKKPVIAVRDEHPGFYTPAPKPAENWRNPHRRRVCLLKQLYAVR